MSRKTVPSYCHHKASGQAYLKVDGKRIYLGKHGTPESHRRYSDEIAKWQARQTEQTENVTIRELTLLYLKRSEQHYRKDGKITSEVHCIRSALRTLNRLYKDKLANQFTPVMLAQVRSAMIESDRERESINRNVGRIVRCWKWGVSQGLVSVSTYQALTTLQGLQAGRCDARESKPVQPVKLTDVDAIRDEIAATLWGAIQFQLATAARPNEALSLRLCDIDRTGDVWIYTPDSHKTQHHGKSRIIFCGPKAQAVIAEFTTIADPEAYLFAVPGSEGKKAYRRDNYGLAIRRACERAFNMPKELRRLKRDSPEELKRQAKEWREKHVWTPNQLRHTAATEIRKSSDVETAKTILGHSELRTTEIYAERELTRAAEIIGKIG